MATRCCYQQRLGRTARHHSAPSRVVTSPPRVRRTLTSVHRTFKQQTGAIVRSSRCRPRSVCFKLHHARVSGSINFLILDTHTRATDYVRTSRRTSRTASALCIRGKHRHRWSATSRTAWSLTPTLLTYARRALAQPGRRSTGNRQGSRK
jgi:hypothetical protein